MERELRKATPSQHAHRVEHSLASIESALAEDAGSAASGRVVAAALLELAAALEGWLTELDESMGRAALPWTREALERISARERHTTEDLRRLAALAPAAPAEALADMFVAARIAVGLATRAEVRKARVRREADREAPGGQG